jgi:hypothetical protein
LIIRRCSYLPHSYAFFLFSQNICQNDDVLKLVGNKGSCRMVLAPKKIEILGECQGVYAGSLPCKINYVSDKTESILHMKCGADPENPSVDQSMEAQVSSFNLAAIVQPESGKTIVVSDPNLYTTITNQMIEIIITETEGKKESAILIHTQGGKQAFSDVSCH